MKRLRTCELSWAAEKTTQKYLFPNCLTVFAHLHVIFNALEEALKSHPLWDDFEGPWRAFVLFIGSKPLRDRIIAVCMTHAETWERRLLHSFSNHKFDWRWGMLEELVCDVCEVLEILQKYFDVSAMTRDGDVCKSSTVEFHAFLQSHKLVGVLHCVAGFCHGVGQAAAWLTTCKCPHHQHLYEEGLKYRALVKRFIEAGEVSGRCFWAGRLAALLAHDGGEALIGKVAPRTGRFVAWLLLATNEVRVAVLDFESHIINRWRQTVARKLIVWSDLPLAICGLWAAYFGKSWRECKDFAARLQATWIAIENKHMVHRVAQRLFTDPVLSSQLLEFIDTDLELHKFPQLFVFILRYACILIVEHWLEGRHRYLKMNAAGSRAAISPVSQSALLRSPEALEMMRDRDFLNFVAMQWRAKTTFNQLLESIASGPLTKLPWCRKASMVYGSDVESQFRPIPEYTRLSIDWSKLHSRASPKPVQLAYFESEALNYLMDHLVTGATLVVTQEMAALARGKVAGVSSLSLAALLEVFFGPPRRDAQLCMDDVVITVVDSNPERKFQMRPSHTEKSSRGMVVVRVHAPVTQAGREDVPCSWKLESWDVRRWLRDDDTWTLAALHTLRVPALQPKSSFVPVRRLPSQKLQLPAAAAPPPLCDADAGDYCGEVATVSYERCVQVLAQIATLADERASDDDAHGVSMMDLPEVSFADLEVLVARNCLSVKEDIFGVATYSLATEGIDVKLTWKINSPVHLLSADIDMGQARSKLALLFALFQQGWRPVLELPPGHTTYKSADEEKVVLLGNIRRSKLYFWCLLNAKAIFEAGFLGIAHCGPHHYYACLASRRADLIEPINNMDDVAAVKDVDFKKLLHGSAPLVLALEDDDAEGDVELLALAGAAPVDAAIVPVPAPMPAPAILPPPTLGPMHFTFPARREIVIRLDGRSHTSGIRRAYSKCPFHPDCYKYTHLTVFPEPWQSVAYILAYMRAGAAVEVDSKAKHQAVPVAHGGDLLDEMPAILFDPSLVDG